MNESSPLKLDLTSDPGQLSRVRETLRGWCLAHRWPEPPIADLVLALDEALTNVIRHGYDGAGDKRILVHIREVHDPGAGEGIEIEVRDFGKQVDLDSIRGRDLDQPRPGGLGVHIIRAMMDVAEYTHADGGGMRLVMRKYKSAPERPESPKTGTS